MTDYRSIPVGDYTFTAVFHKTSNKLVVFAPPKEIQSKLGIGVLRELRPFEGGSYEECERLAKAWLTTNLESAIKP